MRLSCRDYQGITDLPAMVELSRRTWAADHPHEYPAGQVCWELPRLLPQDKVRLWHDSAGRLVAYAICYPSSGHGDVVDPRFLSESLYSEMLNWAQGCCKHGVADTVDCGSQEPVRQALLRWLGYERMERYMLLGSMPLQPSLSVPAVPEVFSLRGMTGPGDAALRVAAQAQAFGPGRTTVDRYLQVMSTPDYRADLDIVAVTPEGAFAAFCTCWFDAHHRTAWLEPVGVQPTYRQQGLGRAVVMESLRRAQQAGATRAYVKYDPASAPACRLYESCGFSEMDRFHAYRRVAAV